MPESNFEEGDIVMEDWEYIKTQAKTVRDRYTERHWEVVSVDEAEDNLYVRPADDDDLPHKNYAIESANRIFKKVD
jgi:hypothetical protein